MQTGPFTNRQGGRQLKYCLVSIDILHGQLLVRYLTFHFAKHFFDARNGGLILTQEGI